MATRGGYTPAEVREMTLADANMLLAYWGRVPSLRDIVARFVGVEDQPRHPSAGAIASEPPEFEE